MVLQKWCYYTPWVKKQDTKLLFISLSNIDWILKFFHSYTQQEICNKKITTDQSHLKGVTTLSCEILVLLVFRKASTESTVTADRACACWRECDRGKWAGTKPICPPTNSSFNTLNSTIWCCTDHFSLWSWFLVWSV